MKKWDIKCRYVLIILGFWANFLHHAQKVNLSVAIVAMVEDPVRRVNITSSECFPTSQVKQPYPKSVLFSFLSEDSMNDRLNWDHNTQALILSAYYYGYVATQVLGGRIAEMFGAKWLYLAGMLSSSLLCVASPLVAVINPFLFVALRILQGMMAGFIFPLYHILLSKWIPSTERNLSASMVYGGLSVGNVGGLLFSGLLCQSEALGGWPSAFYLFGIMGICWCFLWTYYVYDSPNVHPRIQPEELKYIMSFQTDNSTDQLLKIPWKYVFSSTPFIVLMFAHVGHSWGQDTLLLELPTYMHEVMGVDIGQNGVISALPFTLQAISAWGSAFIVDKLIETNRISEEMARKGCNSVAFFGAAACLISLTFMGCSYFSVIACLCIAMFFDGISKSGFFVNHMDLAPDFAGTLFGITNTISSIDGFLVPYLVSILTEGQASLKRWANVFVVAGMVYLVTGIGFLCFGTTKQQPWASNVVNRPLLLSESLGKIDNKK